MPILCSSLWKLFCILAKPNTQSTHKHEAYMTRQYSQRFASLLSFFFYI